MISKRKFETLDKTDWSPEYKNTPHFVAGTEQGKK